MEQQKKAPILIHCAHGRGRSTTALCAALVKAGYHRTWQDAYAFISTKRPCVKLNAKMRAALESWQAEFNNSKKMK